MANIDGQQFSLCWTNFNTNLSVGLHKSLCRVDLVDVTLAAEGQLVKAHRLVLSACSPYFQKMFTTMPANQHAFVFLKDVTHAALKDLIQFMYCGEVNVSQDALPTFISTAEALQIKGLAETCESSAPAPPPPASQTGHVPIKAATSIPASVSTPLRPRSHRTVQHTMNYKEDSEDSSDDKQTIVVQQSLKRKIPQQRNETKPMKRNVPLDRDAQSQQQQEIMILGTANSNGVIEFTDPQFDSEPNYGQEVHEVEDAGDNEAIHIQDETEGIVSGFAGEETEGDTSATQGDNKGLAFVTGQRGFKHLVLDQYRYIRQYVNGSKAHWMCAKQSTLKCKARVTTKDDEVHRKTGEHNHDVDH